MSRSLVIHSASIFLIGLLIPACTSVSTLDEPPKDPGEQILYARHLNSCDIDIRPTGRTEIPEQRLTVEYAVYEATSSAPAQHELSLTPWYSGDTIPRMRVTDESAQKTLLTTLSRTRVVRIEWVDVAGKKAVVKVNGASFLVTAVGTYDGTERIASPAFELEDAPVQGAVAEKVRIRCHYRGLRVSLIVTKS